MNFFYNEEHLSTSDYLKDELISLTKHEYLNSEEYAVAVASSNHNRIATNLISEFRTAQWKKTTGLSTRAPFAGLYRNWTGIYRFF